MPSGGYRPGAGRPRKNPVDQQLEGKPASTAAAKPAVKNATYGSFPCKKSCRKAGPPQLLMGYAHQHTEQPGCGSIVTRYGINVIERKRKKITELL